MSPPSKLLARYGEDMVLRFNVSTEYEAEKLAEAASTLFLDVWEFNDNWVDIRLAKDVVSAVFLRPEAAFLTNLDRSRRCLGCCLLRYKMPMRR